MRSLPAEAIENEGRSLVRLVFNSYEATIQGSAIYAKGMGADSGSSEVVFKGRRWSREARNHLEPPDGQRLDYATARKIPAL